MQSLNRHWCDGVVCATFDSGKLSNPVGSTEGQTTCSDENGQFLGGNGEDTAQTVLGTILVRRTHNPRHVF